MTRALILAALALMPIAADAQDAAVAAENISGNVAAAQPPALAEGVANDDAADSAAADADAFAPIDAAGIALESFKWTHRPVLVFADSPADPQFRQQMENLEQGWPELAERDVVVIVDTDPGAMTDIRRTLRPRGFSLVWVDKDGAVRLRKPLPWSVREIVHAIDKSPLRRQEILDQRLGR